MAVQVSVWQMQTSAARHACRKMSRAPTALTSACHPRCLEIPGELQTMPRAFAAKFGRVVCENAPRLFLQKPALKLSRV
jgi:hypothetical protein